MSEPRHRWTLHHRLAAGALIVATMAMIAGEPERGKRVDVSALAGAVEREEDHVTALELARLIRARTPRLRVIDLRSAEEFAEYGIPGAERMSLTELTRQRFERDATVVLYSEGGTHAAQGWFLLRARGVDRVYFLRGGIFEWVDQIMEARIATDATPAERDAFREVSEMSRYFGGQPGISDRPRSVLDEIALPRASGSDAREPTGREATSRLRRRGC